MFRSPGLKIKHTNPFLVTLSSEIYSTAPELVQNARGTNFRSVRNGNLETRQIAAISVSFPRVINIPRYPRNLVANVLANYIRRCDS